MHNATEKKSEDPKDPKYKKPPFTLNDVLKCAAILMCLSVAYKALYSPTPAVTPSAATTVQTAPATEPSSDEQLKIDTDKIGSLIQKKAETVLAGGQVRMSLGQASSQQDEKPAQPAIAARPLAEVPAQASAQQPSIAIAQPNQAASNRVPKIGFNTDGSQMTSSEKAEQIKGIIAKIPDVWTVNWKAQDEKASIYVFTDPTCPYCQKLHHAIPDLNAAGITVHYFLYPRDMGHNTGQVTKTQENLNNAWCSADQKSAVNDAYAGYKIPTADCSQLPPELKRIGSPVADHYFLGELFDVTGTPTIITSAGEQIVGFNNAQSLISNILN